MRAVMSESKQGARLVVSPGARDRRGEAERRADRQREDLRACTMGLRVRPPTIICSRKRPAGLGLVLRGHVNGSDAPTTGDLVRWLLSTKSKAINS